MALDNFRRVDYRLDKANSYILDNFFAKEGDYDGRELCVQITDGGVEVDTTGIQLIFNWKHLLKGHSGNKYFEPVDETKGIYTVSYPTQMQFAGLVSAFITVVDNSKITNTRNINLKVEAGADGNPIVAENDFSILQEALMQINMYQNQINTILNDIQSSADSLMATEKAELDALEENYAPQLQAVLQQFNDAMANLTQDSEMITARTSLATGKAYGTLALILQAIENRQIVTDPNKNKKYITTLEVFENKPRLRLEEVI